jgi:hypothetical protein
MDCWSKKAGSKGKRRPQVVYEELLGMEGRERKPAGSERMQNRRYQCPNHSNMPLVCRQEDTDNEKKGYKGTE